MKLIYHPPLRHTSLGKYWDLFCTEEISSKKWSVWILRYQTFRSNCYLGKEFFVGKQLDEQLKANKAPSPLPTNYYEWQRPTILFACRKFESFKECYGKLTQRIQLKGWVWRYICFEGLGLRLELDKAVTCLCNRNFCTCFELLFIEAKFAIVFRAFLIVFWENSNSENKAMKHESHCTGFLHPIRFQYNLVVPRSIFLFPTLNCIRCVSFP